MWKIYYADESTFSNEDGSPKDAPARGVQAIIQPDEGVAWSTETGGDYYVWRDEKWWSCDIFGLFDFLIESGLVKFGRTITAKEFNDIFQRALKEASKGGFKSRERKP